MAPPRPRGGGGGDSPTPPRRPRGGGGGDGTHSIAAAQEATARAARKGRPGGAGRQRDPEPAGAGGQVPGPAGRMELHRPNSRHNLNQIGGKAPAKGENTVVMPGVDTEADLHAIQSGRARWNTDTQRYELPNGRIYGVKDNGTLFPVSGPGFERLGRGEYQALQHYIRSDGDIAAAEAAMARNPFITRSDRQRALEIFRHHSRFRG